MSTGMALSGRRRLVNGAWEAFLEAPLDPSNKPRGWRENLGGALGNLGLIVVIIWSGLLFGLFTWFIYIKGLPWAMRLIEPGTGPTADFSLTVVFWSFRIIFGVAALALVLQILTGSIGPAGQIRGMVGSGVRQLMALGLARLPRPLLGLFRWYWGLMIRRGPAEALGVITALPRCTVEVASTPSPRAAWGCLTKKDIKAMLLSPHKGIREEGLRILGGRPVSKDGEV